MKLSTLLCALACTLLAGCSGATAPTTAPRPQPTRTQIPAAVVTARVRASATARAATRAAAPSPTRAPTLPPTATRTRQPTPMPPTSTPAPTSTPVRAVTVKLATVNLRAGPGTSFEIVGKAAQGDTIVVVGQYQECAWLQIDAPDDTPSWITGGAQYVTLTAPCAELPPGVYRPSTGILADKMAPRGLGELLVKNGTDTDGVVIVTTLAERTLASAYIRAAASFNVTGIPDGVYRLYFSKGEGWAGPLVGFTANATHQRFEDTFRFETSSRQYTTWEVTLYGVAGGQAASESVDPADFPALD